MTEMTGSKAYIKTLEQEGITHIFGITGAALIPICDALLDSKIRYVPGVHEQGSAHMADGYARASGKPGIVQVTSGPGATNIVTGVATAQLDSSPLVAFTGQVPMSMVGTDAFQEVDIIGVTASITKWNHQVRDPARIPWAVKAGLHIANTGRKGAVVIDLPKNITQETAEMDFDVEIDFSGYKPRITPSPSELDWAAKLLAEAEKPVIVAGGGIVSSGAGKELTELAEILMAPTATSLMGKGSIASNHPLSLGLCGMHGREEANYMVPDADVLFVAGSRFSDRTTGSLAGFAPNARVIHMDIDKSEIDKNVDSVTRIWGDAKHSLIGLIDRVKTIKRSQNGDWTKKIQEFKRSYQEPNDNSDITGPAVIRAIRNALPSNAIVTTDVGQHQMLAAIHYDVYEPCTFLTSGGLGTMGWGVPAAIGAKAALPDRKVLSICGDGGFHMTENNLSTAVDDDFPIIVVLLNNRMLGMVAQWQRLFMNGRYAAVQRNYSVDYTELVKDYGAHGVRIESMKQLNTELTRAVGADYTTVIEVPMDPEENVYPMIPPGMGLKDILTED
ncbi:MAG: biosynthetic-type acetolactate synthase large subunit [Candidatus Bathyarchaeota archaeon]|nr:biosynthetic-type acetolactate synthase large subunit [Candidatus Bathyarchaeota archaeon]